MLTHNQLIELSKTFPLNFHLEPADNLHNADSIKMSNHFNPWSIRQSEANIIYKLLVENKLKSGFEIATGFGISATVIGQALKVTGGKLVTMDAYLEEDLGCGNYGHDTIIVKTQNADGYKMVSNLIRSLELENFVKPTIGWSPQDTINNISLHHTDKQLDFAFIDGGHSKEQIFLDVKEIIDMFTENAIIIMHDYGCVGDDTKNLILSKGFSNFRNYYTGFGLAAYGRNNVIL
jgi:predicted O-methyltransferase YrrM